MNIEFKNVNKRFGTKEILLNFNFTLSLEGITALMGVSGIGKTTLLRLMCGLEKPDSGEILGFPKNYTFLFQENRLLPFKTVLENVALFSDELSAKIALHALSLGGEEHSYPETLSGGMQRRVALARALAHKSDILLLDEPLKGMDDALRQSALQLLLEEQKKRPILLVTHDKRETEFLNATCYELQGNPINVVGIQHKL